MNSFGMLARGLSVPAPQKSTYGGAANFARYSIGPSTIAISLGTLRGSESGSFVVKNTGEQTIYLLCSDGSPGEVVLSADGTEGTQLGWPLMAGEVETFTDVTVGTLFAWCATASDLWIRVGA
ncbi:MAG TPA: hypothetical protein VFQ35_05905 [Polyangiaceae bacterium]|nr:hypothetical protein [Polyangiaceae bacterium]